jgi:hypothetical protein
MEMNDQFTFQLGYEYANGRAKSLGDEDAAIWTPLRR